MRWSDLFIPTLREDPASVEAASHRLLVRAGYIRQLTAGVYSLLPLAQRVRLKVIEIIRQEMNKIGGQEFLLSALQPIELWQESGRLEAVSDVMFRLKDRKTSELALGLTHEEVFTSIARAGLLSYKQLPQIWYQIQTKFRDELRPKGGLLRVREFTMKDAYSFDFDYEGLDSSFQKHADAYHKIFSRCGLSFRAVEASSGAMGGSQSTEFMVITPAGEDTLVLCSACEYAANVERAESRLPELKDSPAAGELEEFPTPGVKTIKDLEVFNGGASAQQQLKTLIYSADGQLIIALVQGDQELNEAKLQAATKAATLKQATDTEIFAALGANPGSLGACGVKSGDGQKIKCIIADHRLQNRNNMVTGANKDGFHVRNVSVNRDIKVDTWTDLHTAQPDEQCIKCGGKLTLTKGLEIGHIFKLGTRYSVSMNAGVLGPEGNSNPIVMGSYGIGVERLMAAVAELSNDQYGLIWPVAIAPVHVMVVPTNVQEKHIMDAAEEIGKQLEQAGVEYILDDRNERPGVKFNDADLIGVPFRITVGKKVPEGLVEFKERGSKSSVDVPLADAAKICREKILAGSQNS